MIRSPFGAESTRVLRGIFGSYETCAEMTDVGWIFNSDLSVVHGLRGNSEQGGRTVDGTGDANVQVNGG